MDRSNFVVSANYKDRQSAQQWLIRKGDETPKDAVAYPFVHAQDVLLACSDGYPEDEYGCTMLALCGQAAGHDTQQEFDKEGLVSLDFHNYYFSESGTDKVVCGMSDLYLDVDGKMYARNVLYSGK